MGKGVPVSLPLHSQFFSKARAHLAARGVTKAHHTHALPMQSLVDYASSGSEEEEVAAQAEEGAPTLAVVDPLAQAGPAAARSLSSGSDDDEASPASSSGAASDDSAAVRAAAAAAKLARLEEAAAAAAAAAAARPPATALPDPLAALGAGGSGSALPAFLAPEATRLMAAPAHRGGAGLVVRPAVEARPTKRPRADGAGGLPPPPPAGPASAAVEAAQWAAAAACDAGALRAAKGVPEGGGGARRSGGKATAAMPVAEALATGAALPRKGQTMKERQRHKAAAGQRATGEWKSDAFMTLKQQYD